MSKKSTLITVSIVSLLLSACSVDQRYKREVNGNDNYLKTPALKKLNAADGLTLPAEQGDYYIYPNVKVGAVGDDVDIRPPLQPIAALTGSNADYDGKVAVLQAPSVLDIWRNIKPILNEKNISIATDSQQEILTAPTTFTRADEDIARQASFAIRHNQNGASQTVSVELLTLQANGENLLDNAIERQRYTVGFFNMLMLELQKGQKAAAQQ
ncbi:outer membrane protein assembly factor BamC [Utexia brackfieldae]|uniref:outer membrane protein assembly factor BamC n=1 Tax=Utexia brackfieldae TaxID=3074108 RepID=UPI00370D6B2D